MSSLLLEGCRLVVTEAGEPEISGASIAIRDGWITSVGQSRPAGDFDMVLNASRFVAIPGLVNTHHHLYQTLTRGFPESRGQKLFQWLRSLYPIWAGLSEEMIRASTMTGLAELLLSGCTTSADHLYVFPPGSERFFDAQVEAALEIGMRFHPTRGSMDLGESQGGLPPAEVVQSLETILNDSQRVIEKYHDPSPGSMLRVALAPCSPFSATRELMAQTASLARESGVRLHTHIAETMDEDAFSRNAYGVSPVALLNQVGWVREDVWLAHCVHPAESDVELLASGGAAVAHCPTSNMLLGSGLAPTPALLAAGVPVGLGVDGSASNDGNDLRNETKQALLSARIRDGVEAMTARQALRMATLGGAECLGRDDIGTIVPGGAADIALFDSEALELAGGQEDLVGSIVLSSTRPSYVIVNGEILVEDGHLVRLDPKIIASEQNRQARRLLERGGLA
jgi:cytosine/adenosine deaminase-related metal-dependent hydrolase